MSKHGMTRFSFGILHLFTQQSPRSLHISSSKLLLARQNDERVSAVNDVVKL